MKALVLILCFAAFSVSAKELTKTMPKACKVKLLSTVEDSVAANAAWIVDQLRDDWKLNPSKTTASYGECGSSDFYYIEVDKLTCEIIAYDVGDSDGECE
jgi:hypothetical protein